MAERRFQDREGRRWAIRVRSRSEWLFEPVDGNAEPARTVTPPGYEQRDPFELSVEELQRLLDSAPPPRPRSAKNPFLD